MLPTEEHKECGIYEIRFIGDKEGRVYIGSSKDVNKREWSYWNKLSRGKCHNKNIMNLIKEFGQDGMRFVKVATCHEEIRHEVEQEIKDSYNQSKILNIVNTCAPPRKSGRVTEEFVHGVFNRKMSGQDSKDIAKDLGYSRRYIDEILLRRRGIYIDITPEMQQYVEDRKSRFLSLDDIHEVLYRALSGQSRKVIADRMGVSLASINNLLTGGFYQDTFDKKAWDQYKKYRKTLDKTPIVLEIFQRTANGESKKQIAEQMDISRTTVTDILNRKVLLDVEVPEDLIKRAAKNSTGNVKFSDKEIVNIFKLFYSGMTRNEIADKLGHSRSHTYAILKRKSYSKVEIPQYLVDYSLKYFQYASSREGLAARASGKNLHDCIKREYLVSKD